MQDVSAPVVVGVAVLTAVALTWSGVHGLRLWTIGGRDEPNQAAETAARRSFRGLILATLCFMAVAVIAVLGLWALLGGDF